MNLLPGPGVTSYANACSRSTTTLVVGGVLPSKPMRTPLTPALPTGILFCAVAIVVAGNSTTTREGELNLLTFGVTASRGLISIWILSGLRTTFTFSRRLFWLDEGPVTGATFGAGALASFEEAGLAGF